MIMIPFYVCNQLLLMSFLYQGETRVKLRTKIYVFECILFQRIEVHVFGANLLRISFFHLNECLIPNYLFWVIIFLRKSGAVKECQKRNKMIQILNTYSAKKAGRKNLCEIIVCSRNWRCYEFAKSCYVRYSIMGSGGSKITSREGFWSSGVNFVLSFIFSHFLSVYKFFSSFKIHP